MPSAQLSQVPHAPCLCLGLIQFMAPCSHNGPAVKCNQLRLIRSHFPNYEYKWSPVGPGAAADCLLTALVRAVRAGAVAFVICVSGICEYFAVMILEIFGSLYQSHQQQQQQLTARRRRRQHFLAVINGVWSMNLAQVSAACPLPSSSRMLAVHKRH